MTHEELLEKIDYNLDKEIWFQDMGYALRAVVELHKPEELELPNVEKDNVCSFCWHSGAQWFYPCPTIHAIEKELR